MTNTAILLDIDDTLLDFHKAEIAALTETLRRIGIEPQDATLIRYSEINVQMWEKLERGELTRDEVLVKRFELLFAELGEERSGREAAETYEGLLAGKAYLLPGAKELLETLYGRYELYIVSNGCAAVQDSRIGLAGIGGYFKGIFVSERVGADKPSKEFFDRCFGTMEGFSRERAIIVGDSLTSDILGGINAGIRTCWFDPKGKPGRDDIRPDFVISELMQLPALLEDIFG